jgi:hypothetical protein
MCWFLGSCAIPLTNEEAPYYSPGLSATDIEQIKALVAKRPDIKQPIWTIQTEEGRSDRANVYAGRWDKTGDQSDYFTVAKQHGKWRIISRIQRDTLKKDNTVVVS